MENRFLEMDEHLRGVAVKGTGTCVKSRGKGSNGGGGRRGAMSLPSSLWSKPFAATDRALVILIENGGVDLGIPALVDKVLSALPDWVAEKYRQDLIDYVKEKIKSFTDNLAETVELAANKYGAAKPDFYGDVIVLRDSTASYAALKNTLLDLSRREKIIDIFILTHGGSDRICVTGDIRGHMIKDMKSELGRPLSIRSVYMMNCVGSSLNQAWIDAGARVSSGSIRNNYLPEPTMHFFWTNWKEGQNFENAVTNAYRKTISVMNGIVRGFLVALPLPGTSLIAAAIDFADMDFVKDSAPVIQGQRSLTISSDSLSAAQSVASSLATTVLPVSYLRSLGNGNGNGNGNGYSRGQSLSGRLSDAGVELIKSFEGFIDKLYNDPAGHCTVGYGTLVHKGNCDGRSSEQPYTGGVTRDKATELLRQEAEQFQKVINDSVKVELNQNQNDALVSFVYNVGTGNFGQSTLLKLLNKGDYAAVPTELKKWTKARVDGKLVDLPGLVKRRAAEAELFQRAVGAAKAQSMSGGTTARAALVALLDKWAGTAEGVTQAAPGKPLFSDFRDEKYLEAQRKNAARNGVTFTTCIEFMGWALAQAVAEANTTLKVSPTLLNANLWYKEKRASLPPGAWVDYTPGTTERPDPGDVFVLTFAEHVYKDGMPKTDANIKNWKGSFSHIGFFRSATSNQVQPGEKASETWETIDGGQGAAGRYKYDKATDTYTLVQKGAERIDRISRVFYPEENSFPGGVQNQAASPRRLLGWLKIDKVTD
ncbi:MAG TPA: lysozyme [Pyrinomonadaceae bacterium]